MGSIMAVSPAGAGPTAIDTDLLQQYSGQQAVTSLAQASELHRRATSEYREAQSRLRVARWRRRTALVRLVFARYGTLPILDALAVSTLLVIPSSLWLIFVAGSGPTALVTNILVIYGAVGGFLGWFFHGSYVSKSRRVQDASADLRRCDAAIVWFLSRAQTTRSAAQRAESLVEGIKRAAIATDRRRRKTDEIEALLRVDCRVLSGTAFEQHLESIFRLHGYDVSRIGQAGDQGTDLIVQRPGGPRIAVQAKCYAGSVGNDAVQQVYAGMTFHGCHECALITNSYATRSATELASRVQCRVIDGHTLPELIRGNLLL
jgi:restriction system protein